MNVKEGDEGYRLVSQAPKPLGMVSLLEQERALVNAGPNTKTATLSVAQQAALSAKRQQKAMALAMKPGQQILMNAFMMYMSGSQLNIFSISVTSGAILGPLGGLLSVQQAFGQFPDNVNTAKLAYVALNLVWLALGLYKMSNMRLLPTMSADWTGKIVFKDMLETTSAPPMDTYGFLS